MIEGLIPYHLAGDVVATTASVIGQALVALPGATIEISSEVGIEGEHYDLTIYPTDRVAEGAKDFLVGGNIWLSPENTHVLVKTIVDILERNGIVFELELTREGTPTQVFRHARYRELDAPLAGDAPGTRSVDGDLPPGPDTRIIMGDRLQSGTSDEVRSGWIASASRERALITLTTSHDEPYDRIHARLALDFDRIAPLEYVGVPPAGVPYADMLVERLPAGQPASVPLAEPDLVRLGVEIAEVLSRVHAARQVVDGLRPELIYLHDRGGTQRLSGLVPRGPKFISGAPIARGIRSYHVPYSSPEQLLSNQAAPASDIFALCATLYFLGTAIHPFGDQERLAELVCNLAAGAITPWPGTPKLGELLLHGMSNRADDRPTANDLATELSRLA